MEHQISEQYPALSPLDIEKRPFLQIIDLYADCRRLQIREKKRNDPNRVIRRKAGDDWF